MADVNDLTVHDIVIRDDVDFRPASFGQQITRVSFMVGNHGPFQLSYRKSDATSDKINGDIQHQVVELRRITQGM